MTGDKHVATQRSHGLCQNKLLRGQILRLGYAKTTTVMVLRTSKSHNFSSLFSFLLIWWRWMGAAFFKVSLLCCFWGHIFICKANVFLKFMDPPEVQTAEERWLDVLNIWCLPLSPLWPLLTSSEMIAEATTDAEVTDTETLCKLHLKNTHIMNDYFHRMDLSARSPSQFCSFLCAFWVLCVCKSKKEIIQLRTEAKLLKVK